MNDFNITPHFSFFEMTTTNKPEFQQQNRNEGIDKIDSLANVCSIMEHIREYIDLPIRVHSGYRCTALNEAVGGSPLSQHLKGEACDFFAGDNIDDLFAQVIRCVSEKKIDFGQLIKESQDSGYDSADWIHISLGSSYRPKEKCGEILEMKDGVYTMLQQVNYL